MPDDKGQDHTQNDNGYVLQRQKGKRVEPSTNPATELIRRKIESLYDSDPDAKEEPKYNQQATQPISKHRHFMNSLSNSGKSLAQIQQEWHNYYAQLPNEEKHQVWQEFYEAHGSQSSRPVPAAPQPEPATQTGGAVPELAQQTKHQHHEPDQPRHTPQPLVAATQNIPHHAKRQIKDRTKQLGQLKHKITGTVRERAGAQSKAKQHFKSLAVGLSVGLIAIIVVMFGFFNEIVIARLIQPSGGSTATPIILNADGVAPTDEPELIIPKINVQLPVVYDVSSTQEEVIQQALDNGVTHYPGTSMPGQKGNTAIFGHSSNNIFNPGKYKFAFALLKDLVPGDVFYLTYEGRVYTYSVYDKRVVEPHETWVLGNAPDKVATATLITCDPPGTTINRLVVWAEQISPDPTGNDAAPAPASNQVEELPAQGPTLWGRFWSWITP